MARGTNLAVLGAAAAAFASQPSLRTFVAKWSGYNAPGGVWRIVAILFALANLKNMPFVWHVSFPSYGSFRRIPRGPVLPYIHVLRRSYSPQTSPYARSMCIDKDQVALPPLLPLPTLLPTNAHSTPRTLPPHGNFDPYTPARNGLQHP
jgi:hypothetical protein